MTLLVSFAVALAATAAFVFAVGSLIDGLPRLNRAYPRAFNVIIGIVLMSIPMACATLIAHDIIYGCNDPERPVWMPAYCAETP